MRKEMREFFTPVFFMHSPMQKKCAAKAAHGARGAGERFPLLDCTAPGTAAQRNFLAFLTEILC